MSGFGSASGGFGGSKPSAPIESGFGGFGGASGATNNKNNANNNSSGFGSATASNNNQPAGGGGFGVSFGGGNNGTTSGFNGFGGGGSSQQQQQQQPAYQVPSYDLWKMIDLVAHHSRAADLLLRCDHAYDGSHPDCRFRGYLYNVAPPTTKIISDDENIRFGVTSDATNHNKSELVNTKNHFSSATKRQASTAEAIEKLSSEFRSLQRLLLADSGRTPTNEAGHRLDEQWMQAARENPNPLQQSRDFYHQNYSTSSLLAARHRRPHPLPSAESEDEESNPLLPMLPRPLSSPFPPSSKQPSLQSLLPFLPPLMPSPPVLFAEALEKRVCDQQRDNIKSLHARIGTSLEVMSQELKKLNNINGHIMDECRQRERIIEQKAVAVLGRAMLKITELGESITQFFNYQYKQEDRHHSKGSQLMQVHQELQSSPHLTEITDALHFLQQQLHVAVDPSRTAGSSLFCDERQSDRFTNEFEERLQVLRPLVENIAAEEEETMRRGGRQYTPLTRHIPPATAAITATLPHTEAALGALQYAMAQQTCVKLAG